MVWSKKIRLRFHSVELGRLGYHDGQRLWFHGSDRIFFVKTSSLRRSALGRKETVADTGPITPLNPVDRSVSP